MATPLLLEDLELEDRLHANFYYSARAEFEELEELDLNGLHDVDDVDDDA